MNNDFEAILRLSHKHTQNTKTFTFIPYHSSDSFHIYSEKRSSHIKHTVSNRFQQNVYIIRYYVYIYIYIYIYIHIYIYPLTLLSTFVFPIINQLIN